MLNGGDSVLARPHPQPSPPMRESRQPKRPEFERLIVIPRWLTVRSVGRTNLGIVW